MKKSKHTKPTVVSFNQSMKKSIIASLGYDINTEGYLVERDNPTQKVLTLDGIEVTEKNFAGVKHGSVLVFNSDLPSLIKLSDRMAVLQ